MAAGGAASSNVLVAVRVRPLLAKEIAEQRRECVRCPLDAAGQVIIGKDRKFTFDYVFDGASLQADVFQTSIRPLLDSLFEGFNATVFAYGQTGSGKTHTMGTGSQSGALPEEYGVLPRVIDDLFARIGQLENGNECKVRASFLEIHNNIIRDLLDPSAPSKSIQIREGPNGDILPYGVIDKEVCGADALVDVLESGSLYRTTGSTLMNATSSRSHAVFTITLIQRRTIAKSHALIQDSPLEAENSSSDKDDGDVDEEAEFLTSKFHFVDLAGSERLKRTGAEGERMKEGIHINCGLLALGNVISALGDPDRTSKHVPFRDSKITRLLQDSLGGNSKTLMIACISCAEVDFEESLNTLRYASRARNIENKPVVNRDPNSARLEQYRKRIAYLEAALQSLGVSAIDLVNESGAVMDSSARAPRIEDLQQENLYLEEQVRLKSDKLQALKVQFEGAIEAKMDALKQRDELHLQVEAAHGALCAANLEIPTVGPEQRKVLDVQLHTIESLRTTIQEQQQQLSQMQQVARGLMRCTSFSNDDGNHVNEDDLTQLADEDKVEELSEIEEAPEEESDVSDAVENVNDMQHAKEMKELEYRRNARQHSHALKRFNTEIAKKNALLEQIERNRAKSDAQRAIYDMKIEELERRVREVEEERNKALTDMSQSKNCSEESTNITREKYNERVQSLKREMIELKNKLKSHEQLLRMRPQREAQILKLQDDVFRVKKQRVALQRQMKDEAEKHREWISNHSRRLKAMMKESRKDKFKLQKLEVKLQKQDIVLKRKQEKNVLLQRELHDAKKKSTKTSGPPMSEHAARSLKFCVRREIDAILRSKELSKEHEGLLAQRDELKSQLESATEALSNLDRSGERSVDDAEELSDRIDSLTEQLKYVAEKAATLEEELGDKRLALAKVGKEVVARLPITDSDSSAEAIVVLLNELVSYRRKNSAQDREVKKLAADVVRLQAECVSTSSKLEAVRADADARIIEVEQSYERNLETMLDETMRSDDDSPQDQQRRLLKTELEEAKKEQEDLMSPICTRSRSRKRAAWYDQFKTDTSPDRVHTRLTDPTHFPESTIAKMKLRHDFTANAKPRSSNSIKTPRRIPDGAGKQIAGAKRVFVIRPGNTVKCREDSESNRMGVFERLTAKDNFTGISRTKHGLDQKSRLNRSVESLPKLVLAGTPSDEGRIEYSPGGNDKDDTVGVFERLTAKDNFTGISRIKHGLDQKSRLHRSVESLSKFVLLDTPSDDVRAYRSPRKEKDDKDAPLEVEDVSDSFVSEPHDCIEQSENISTQASGVSFKGVVVADVWSDIWKNVPLMPRRIRTKAKNLDHREAQTKSLPSKLTS